MTPGRCHPCHPHRHRTRALEPAVAAERDHVAPVELEAARTGNEREAHALSFAVVGAIREIVVGELAVDDELTPVVGDHRHVGAVRPYDGLFEFAVLIGDRDVVVTVDEHAAGLDRQTEAGKLAAHLETVRVDDQDAEATVTNHPPVGGYCLPGFGIHTVVAARVEHEGDEVEAASVGGIVDVDAEAG